MEAIDGIDYVLHHAALGSVPRSINDPIGSNSTNISGFLNVNMLVLKRKLKIHLCCELINIRRFY